jgi:lysylphosphatidylglycerol synthetase-like protein (DUF2156 family)
MFGIYLFTTERTGDAAKVTERIAWAILIFSIVTVSASVRARITLRILALFLALFVAVNLLSNRRHHPVSHPCTPLEQAIRPGSSLLQLNYPADEFGKRYDLLLLNYQPMLHAAEVVALRSVA